MAIIDPVRLLQANPAENLSNLNAIDQADSLTDQSLMSFPDELLAAKHHQRDDTAGSDPQGQDSPDSPFNLQNLPVNSALAAVQPANIADSIDALDVALPVLTAKNPSLTQLEVAQSLGADAVLAALSPEEALPVTTVSTDADVLIANPAAASSVELDPVGTGLPPGKAVPVASLDTPLVDTTSTSLITNTEAAQTPAVNAVPLQPSAIPTQPSPVNANALQASALTDAEQAAPLPAALQAAQQTPEQSQADIGANPIAAANALSAADAANAVDAADEAKVASAMVTDTNTLRAQVTQGNQEVSALNAAALKVTQESAQLQAAAGALSNEAEAIAVQAGVVAMQDSAETAENVELRSVSLNAKEIKAGLTLAPSDDLALPSANGDDALLAKAVGDAAQLASTQSAIAAARTESLDAVDAIVQGLRLDNAKGSALNLQESAPLDAVAMKDLTLADSGEALTLSSTSNSASGIADLGSRTVTSPFSQELRLAQAAPPLRLEPQNASLVAGPLHVEVMRVLRQGGGRVILEVTPPDQSSIQLDLRLDGNGKAYLIVEGANDSTKARLEQGGAQLKEQLAQMGLSLSLDMRDRSSQSDHIPFAFNPNFARNGNGLSGEADAQLADLMSVSRSGITSDGRVSIYA